MGICPHCEETLDEEGVLFHAGCCPHRTIDLAMDPIYPDREVLDAGTCADCGARVHLEHEDDRVYWEID